MDLKNNISDEFQNIYIIEKADITNIKNLELFYETRELNKNEAKMLNIKLSSKTFSYLPVNSEAVNFQENISYVYSPYIFNIKSFLKSSRIFTIIFSLSDIPYFGKCNLHFSYSESNRNFSLLLKNETNKIILKRKYNYSQREKCIKDFKSIFLKTEELELFSVEKFTQLKNGWFEYLEAIKY